VLGLLAWWVGQPLLLWIGGEDYSLDPVVIGLLTFSSTATGLLAVSGSATLARGHHAVYVAGWTVAAGVAVLIAFAAPLDLAPRLILSLSVGPLIGYAIHLAGLRTGHRAEQRAAALA
jgi:hypothetical protein